MKRLIAIVLTAAIMLSLTACEVSKTDKGNEDALSKAMSEYKKLSELPQDYDSKQAAENGDVVSVHGKGYNVKKLDIFIEKLQKKEPAVVRITQYTIEGDAMIKDLIYDGKSILLKDDNTRDKFAATENRKVIEYKVSDVLVNKSNDGTSYEARLLNGDIIPITWINGK